jgi:hypothetical protein
MKVIVQETWLPFSPAIPELGKIDPNNKAQQKTYIDTPAKNIEKCAGIRGCSNRNAANVQTLERTRTDIEGPYRKTLRQQLEGLNREHGRNITILVPLWDATLSLRQREFLRVVIRQNINRNSDRARQGPRTFQAN